MRGPRSLRGGLFARSAGVWPTGRPARSVARALAAGALALLLALVVLGPTLAGHDPFTSHDDGAGPWGLPLGPSKAHWLGADRLFRDELARLALATRLSLTVALTATALSAVVGTTVGLVAGLAEGTLTGDVLALVLDAVVSLPFIVVLLVLGAALDAMTMTRLVLVLGLSGWVGFARIVRAEVLVVRAAPFVEAARALGRSEIGVATRHVLPQVGPVVVTLAAVTAPQMILAESTLGYLGLGLPPPVPSLGQMVVEGQETLAAAPWLLLAPATVIVLASLAFFLLGEASEES